MLYPGDPTQLCSRVNQSIWIWDTVIRTSDVIIVQDASLLFLPLLEFICIITYVKHVVLVNLAYIWAQWLLILLFWSMTLDKWLNLSDSSSSSIKDLFGPEFLYGVKI